MSRSEPRSHSSDGTRRRRRRRRWPWITLACILLVLGVITLVGFLFVRQALSVRDDLVAAKSELSTITGAVQTGDTSQLVAAGDKALALTTHASRTVQGPLWNLAVKVPVIGENVAAIQDTTRAAQILAKEALPAAVKLVTTLNLKTLKVAGGGINLKPIQEAAADLPVLRKAFADAQAEVAGIDRAALNPAVDGSIGQLLDIIDQAGPAIADIEKNLPTLIDLAGGHGTRRYMIIFQNNAETRATGGNAANTAVLLVRDGRMKLVEDAQTRAYKRAEYGGVGSPYALPAKTRKLYEWDYTLYAQNFTRTPDFPTTAKLFSGLWTKVTRTKLDGVVSVDPVALSYMLKVTGPVSLPDGTKIGSGNAVKLLLSDVYAKFGRDTKGSDAYFGQVTSRVFDRIAAGGWSPTKMIAAFQRGIAEQRIYSWFTRPVEQRLSVQTGTDGILLRSNATSSQVGVYLNDSSHSKLEYYLKTRTAVTCDAVARTVTTTVTMTSSVPGPDLNAFTLGGRNWVYHIPSTTMLLDVLGFALPGGTITSHPNQGDLPFWTRTGVEQGRDARSISVALPMGKTTRVSFTSTVPHGELGPLSVRYSPTVTRTPVSIAGSCNALFPPSHGQ